MLAGRLNTRIEIQQKTKTQDDSGASSFEWRPLIKLWADVRHISGVETMKAETATSTVRASIRIRYRENIHAGMRVTVRGAVYEIEAVLPDSAGRVFTDLVCTRSDHAEYHS